MSSHSFSFRLIHFFFVYINENWNLIFHSWIYSSIKVFPQNLRNKCVYVYEYVGVKTSSCYEKHFIFILWIIKKSTGDNKRKPIFVTMIVIINEHTYVTVNFECNWFQKIYPGQMPLNASKLSIRFNIMNQHFWTYVED